MGVALGRHSSRTNTELIMAHSRFIVPVDDAIKYIESCGWKLRTREGKWYRFDKAPENTGSTNEVSFTLTEIRDAYNNGW
jgi:hypothetical protein